MEVKFWDYNLSLFRFLLIATLTFNYSKMAGLNVYFDLMSQPSRAVVLFLKINSIPFTEKPVALRKGYNAMCV